MLWHLSFLFSSIMDETRLRLGIYYRPLKSPLGKRYLLIPFRLFLPTGPIGDDLS